MKQSIQKYFIRMGNIEPFSLFISLLKCINFLHAQIHQRIYKNSSQVKSSEVTEATTEHNPYIYCVLINHR